MKKQMWILLICLCSCFFSSCGLALLGEKLPEDDRKIRYVLGQTKKTLEKRYQIKCSGFGVAAMTEVKTLELYFEVDHKLTKEEARAMLIDSVQELIKVVANCPEIQPHLQKEGFTEKNAQIVFFIRDKGKVIVDPELAVAGFYKGRLSYKTNDLENLQYKNIENETYQEALALLENGHHPKAVVEEKKSGDSSVDRDIAKMLKL